MSGRSVMLALMLCLPFGALHAQFGSVRAELSLPSIAVDETVTLRVVAIGLDGDLDTTELEQVIDVVGTSASSQISSVQSGQNNRSQTTSLRSWALELQPRSVGQLTVPSVRVGSGASLPLQLTVTEVPADREQSLFVEVSIDESEPWVQSQVIVTLKVYEGIKIVSGSLSPPTGEHLVTEPLGEEIKYQEQRDGRPYQVRERRFAVLPQQSGPLQIDPVTLVAEVPVNPEQAQGFFARTRRVTRRTDPIALTVQPRPDAASGWWLPARSVSFNAAWAGNANAVALEPLASGAPGPVTGRVDEPLTRTLRLQASGVLDTQLPELSPPVVDGLRIYADQVNREVMSGDDGLIAQQDITWAVIPERSGTFTVPALTVSWFDTVSATQRTATVPEATITVLAGADGAGADSLAAPEAASESDGQRSAAAGVSTRDQSAAATGGAPSGWRLAALVAILGWLLTAAAWLISRRRTRPPELADQADANPRQQASRLRLALAGVEASVEDGEISRIAHSVLAWARVRWPDHPPRSLTALSARLPPDCAARASLMELDARLYRPAGRQALTGSETAHGSVASAAETLAELPRSLAEAEQELEPMQTSARHDKSGLPVF